MELFYRSEAAKADKPPVKYFNPKTSKLLSLKVNVVSLYFQFSFSRDAQLTICDAFLS